MADGAGDEDRTRDVQLGKLIVVSQNAPLFSNSKKRARGVGGIVGITLAVLPSCTVLYCHVSDVT